MRAVSIRTLGSPDGMEVVDVRTPIPGEGEVVIRTAAIGVGGVDAVIRRGTLGALGPALPRDGLVPGSEVAGTITAVGAGVEASWLDRRVWAFTGLSGGYAEHALARIENVTPLPAGLTPVDAVALGSAAPVAHFALRQARFAEGESVLIRGAAGSIGIAAVEIAARAGARAVAVTTSSAERGERLRAYGATHVLDRDGNSTRGPEPAGFDVIVDIVAGPAVPSFLTRLAPNGRLVLVGLVAGPPPADFGTALLSRFQRSLSVATFSLDTVPRADLARLRADQFEAAARGELSAVVHAVLPLEAAADAHRRMDAGEVFGRIVLTP
ncbi:zinc-binding dehydrogenase [Kitasatospora sp. NPDC089509]|uniref:zinc-binding dehydrogenase n=1 Tax=Kitasatospora sp. NPDC089509 TaxID=3364079 RepID=UPI0038284908